MTIGGNRPRLTSEFGCSAPDTRGPTSSGVRLFRDSTCRCASLDQRGGYAPSPFTGRARTLRHRAGEQSPAGMRTQAIRTHVFGVWLGAKTALRMLCSPRDFCDGHAVSDLSD